MHFDEMKDDLREQLNLLHQAIAANLTRQDWPFEPKVDIDILELAASNEAQVSMKVHEWVDLISASDRTASVGAILLLLCQAHKLVQTPYNPLGMMLTKNSNRERFEQGAKINSNSEEAAKIESTENRSAAVQVQPSLQKECVTPTVTVSSKIFSKDKNCEEETAELEFLDWCPELNLKRRDFYHPLFCTFRKSGEARQENLLKSPRLLHVQKLYGIDETSFGLGFIERVLEKTAPQLEDLQIETRQISIVMNIQMPRLRRLDIWPNYCVPSCINESCAPLLFSTPPAGYSGLKWLRAHIPRKTLISLLNDHRNTIQELHLGVGTQMDQNQMRSMTHFWPHSCNDLNTMLEDCKLEKLRRLLLIREGCLHSSKACRLQVNAVRRKLPHVTVQCAECTNTSLNLDIARKGSDH